MEFYFVIPTFFRIFATRTNNIEIMKEKKYLIRLYVYSFEDGVFIIDGIESDLFALQKHFKGANGCLAICDVLTCGNGLKLLSDANIPYLPMNRFEDFEIICPNCGEKIDDDMILNTYDETLLSGYNINCDREDCGCQVAKVKYLLDV